ncbi:nitrogen regulation protein NR(I) [Thiolapillus brandeum]|uniref:DNA-binding transcriptional regulator NtrC n=1 Tax=Thiolapillus brandeum TaxID=1076588 RepID=A0A7U6GGN8_9GAMM|nr:nitrogen regulation protein NR(I) [Thiolapillus brandeum]BAO43276.1 two-component system NtrC family nitrogen regulation response regulator [Thiolapillus brandeum]
MSDTGVIWIVDDDRSIRWVLEKALSGAGYETRGFEQADDLLEALQSWEPAAILSDIRMPGMDGLTLLGKVHELRPQVPVIIMTAHSDLDSAVNAYGVGAFEYLPKPFDIDEVLDQVQRAVASRDGESAAQREVRGADGGIIGEAPSMQGVFRAIGRLARSNISVLINGESGTGKELVAQALHQHSPRAQQTFIALNMAAIPRELMESELFGHEKGAFTGAQSRRMGRFEQAQGGTLFLDEIGDMPPEAQTRLLRVLADGEFYRVGGVSPIRADVRIVAATHQDLELLVEQGRFREDLFHRLNVIRIQIPPLRERREDIPLLMDHFLSRAAEELGVPAKILRADALERLEAFSWPGNVRQLENTARWLTVMASGQEIHPQDLPPEILESAEAGPAESRDAEDWESVLGFWVERRHAAGGEGLMAEVEAAMIRAALKATAGRRQDAARLLGWGRNTLTRKLKELEGS